MRCPVRTDSEDTYALDADLLACTGRFGRLCQPFAAAARSDGTATAASAASAASAACTDGDSATICTVAANAPIKSGL